MQSISSVYIPPIKVYRHCIMGSYAIGTSITWMLHRRLLARIPNATVSDTHAGCCGYEKEHAELSRRIAEQRLLPALKSLPQETVVVTNSFSCHHQIYDLSARRPIHLAETIRVCTQ